MTLAMLAAETAVSTTAGIITAIGTIFTAFGGLLIAVSVLVPTLRTAKRAVAVVETVHTIVNQQRTDAQRYNIALSQLLREHGITPPIDQSLPVPGIADALPGQPTGLGGS